MKAQDAVGFARSLATPEELRALLRGLQDDLFVLGADLAAFDLVREEGRLEGVLLPLRVILSGGTPHAAALYVARNVERRAERVKWQASRDESLSPEALVYHQ